MDKLDLNLLVTLDVLLDEGSVVGAAKRLQLSSSAMSRTLARLREVTGDPLLVRAGRGLVPTPRAIELRGHVRQVVDEAERVLRPVIKLDLASLSRTFVIRSTEGFAETYGADLISRVSMEAPLVRLAFLPKLDKESTALRDGTVDLETGVIAQSMGPEVRSHGLFRDCFIGVARRGHKLSKGRMTLERYLSAQHVLIERRGLRTAMVDEALARSGRKRSIAATVGGFGAALALARASDIVATVPEKHTAGLCEGMYRFKLPVDVEDFTISLFWHPRMEADAAHRWLRALVLSVCRKNNS